jgi:NADH:ubiquinone oxidoreductase subunit F (NADH-binding)
VSAVARRPSAPPAGVARLLLDASTRERGLGAHVERRGPLPLRPDLVHVLAEAGLRGRGGAAFPTAAKLDAVRRRRGRPVVVVNAVEGEPASAKDRVLLEVAPHLVIDGAVAAAHAVGAAEAIVAVGRQSREAVLSLHAAIAERPRRPVDVRPVAVADGFVDGEETALLQALAGRGSKPTLKPPYPFERGLGGAPTLVSNAETCAHVALIARYGSEWFRSVGTSAAPGTALVTLGGAVTRPGVREIALGSTLQEVIDAAGGASAALSGVLVGGYFGRWHTPGAAASVVLTPDVIGAGAIVLFPERSCAVHEVARVAAYLADESAGQCGPCVHGLRAVGDALAASVRSDRRAALARMTGQIAGRGACRHPDGAVAFVRSALEVFEADFQAHSARGACGRRASSVLPVARTVAG